MAIKNSALSRPRVAFLLVLALAVTLLFFWVIKGFLLALLLGAIMAALLHPFYGRIVERLGGREGLASGVTEHSDELTRQIEADPDYQKLLPYQEEISEKAGQLAGRVGTFVARELANFVQATAGILLLLFVMLYAMFYFLIDGRTILDATLKYTPLSDDDKTRLLGTFTSVSRATLKGTLVIGIVQGGLAGLAFWVAGIQGAVFWGSVMAVLSIIPGIGTALVWVPAVVFLALNGQVGTAVGVGLWCGLIVGTVDNVLRPRLVGKDTEMPDLLVMLTTLGGLALFGAAGIIVGPVIGALYVTVWKMWGDAVDEFAAEFP